MFSPRQPNPLNFIDDLFLLNLISAIDKQRLLLFLLCSEIVKIAVIFQFWGCETFFFDSFHLFVAKLRKIAKLSDVFCWSSIKQRCIEYTMVNKGGDRMEDWKFFDADDKDDANYEEEIKWFEDYIAEKMERNPRQRLRPPKLREEDIINDHIEKRCFENDAMQFGYDYDEQDDDLENYGLEYIKIDIDLVIYIKETLHEIYNRDRASIEIACILGKEVIGSDEPKITVDWKNESYKENEEVVAMVEDSIKFIQEKLSQREE